MKRLFIPAILAFFVSCTSQTDQKKSATVDPELEKLVLAEGAKISKTAEMALGSQLKKGLAEGGPVYAIRYCSGLVTDVLDTLRGEFDVDIKRASLRIRNLMDSPDQYERKILEDYEKKLQKKEELQPVMQVLDEHFLYAKPILIKGPLCLNCHGKVGTDIQPETFQKIQDSYPNDNAINHKLGDLRGIWSIKFEKEEIKEYLEKST